MDLSCISSAAADFGWFSTQLKLAEEAWQDIHPS